MDSEAFSLVREVFDHLDGTVPRNGREETDRARELFAHLRRPGGRIEAIDDPESFRTPIADLGNWSEDPWDGQPTYAIDSSTTRPFEYTNGLITDTAYAKLGVGGPTLLPTGDRVNRLFFAGTLTETNDVGSDSEYWQGRVVDPTGTFYIYAGQYQPEAASMLHQIETPTYVTVVGKPRSYETDDGETNVAVRPESITQSMNRPVTAG
jgi:hypothetical protein